MALRNSNQKDVITLQQLVSAFFIVFTGKPKNAYKWALIGPKPIAVVFKSLLLLLFIQSWSTKYQCLVGNLLCQPHPYLPPLLGFLK